VPKVNATGALEAESDSPPPSSTGYRAMPASSV
jgi:hypothetical protein